MFKKLFVTMAVFAFVAGAIVGNADAALRHFKLDVYKTTTERGLFDIAYATKLTNDVAYSVHVYSGTTVPITRDATYSNINRTELLSNPWVPESSFDDTGTIDFYADPTYSDDKTVYLNVVDLANGFSWGGGVTFDKDHTIIIDERPGMVHTLWIPGLATGRGQVTSTTAADTGISMRANTIFLDAGVNVANVSTKGSAYTTWQSKGGSLDVYLGGMSASNPMSIITSLDTSGLGYTNCNAVMFINTALRTTSQDSAKNLYVKMGGTTFDGWIWINFIGR